MLFDELLENLKKIEPALETIKSFWLQSGHEAEFQRLSALAAKEGAVYTPAHAQTLKALQKERQVRDVYHEIIKAHADLADLINLFRDDEAELATLKPEVINHCKQVERFKITLLLDDPQDDNNCFLSVNAGAGGTESQDWSEMLVRMYLRFCEKEKLNVHVVDYQPGEEAGIKSATLFIKGKNAYGLLKGEHGIHRLVRSITF